jgi:hypothetical protein
MFTEKRGSKYRTERPKLHRREPQDGHRRRKSSLLANNPASSSTDYGGRRRTNFQFWLRALNHAPQTLFAYRYASSSRHRRVPRRRRAAAGRPLRPRWRTVPPPSPRPASSSPASAWPCRAVGVRLLGDGIWIGVSPCEAANACGWVGGTARRGVIKERAAPAGNRTGVSMSPRIKVGSVLDRER